MGMMMECQHSKQRSPRVSDSAATLAAEWHSTKLCWRQNQPSGHQWFSVRLLPIGTHGMDNDMTNFGIYFAFFFSACMLYAPWGNRILATRPLRFTHWLPGLPWAVMIFTYDEARKFLMRVTSRKSILPNGKTRRITGWLEANTYY